MTKNLRKCMGWKKNILRLSKILHRSYIKKKEWIWVPELWSFRKSIVTRNHDDAWSTYLSCGSLSFQLVFLKPRRLQIIHVWRRKGYISICILSRLLVNRACSKEFTSTALCILLSLACRTDAIFWRFQASRNERGARVLRLRLTRATRSPRTSRLPAKRKHNACSAGYLWSAKIPWQSCLSPVSRSEGLGQRATLHSYFVLFLVPFHVVSGTMAA